MRIDPKLNDSLKENSTKQDFFSGKKLMSNRSNKQMKSVMVIFSMTLVVFLLMSFSANKNGSKEIPVNPAAIEIPDSIQVIIDKSCYDCHCSDSKSFKGKMKLNFDKLNDVKIHKLIAKLTDISEEVKNDDMPPKKAIKKYPEIALSDQQKNDLASWASVTAEKLAE